MNGSLMNAEPNLQMGCHLQNKKTNLDFPSESSQTLNSFGKQ